MHLKKQTKTRKTLNLAFLNVNEEEIMQTDYKKKIRCLQRSVSTQKCEGN